jgi:hypothetical protein
VEGVGQAVVRLPCRAARKSEPRAKNGCEGSDESEKKSAARKARRECEETSGGHFSVASDAVI